MSVFEFRDGGKRMRLDSRNDSVGVWNKAEVVLALNTHAKEKGTPATLRIVRSVLGHEDPTRIQPHDYGTILAAISKDLTTRPHKWMAGAPIQRDLPNLTITHPDGSRTVVRPTPRPPKERA